MSMRDSDLPPPPASGLLALAVVFGSVLVGLWTPISTAHVGPDRREKAVLDIVVLQRRNGTHVLSDTIQLTGVFSAAGTIEYAKGYLRQIHMCADEGDGLWSVLEYNWMAVFKLLEPQEEHLSPFCAQLYDKAKLAIAKGAKAVIVDVRDNEAAAKKLRRSHAALSQPVIIIRGKDASHLRRILLWEVEAVGHIKSATDDQKATLFNEQGNNKDYYNMAIFLGVFVVFSIISIAVILQLRRKWKSPEESATEKTKRVLKKMGTRRYCHAIDAWRDETTDACAICLEKFTGGQELRVIPCSHEFHKECVDPWLLTSQKCPLCLYNIIEYPVSSKADSACTSGDLVEQFDAVPAFDAEMSPFPVGFSVRPRSSFAQRTCLSNHIRYVGTDDIGPSLLRKNPQQVNEVFEELLRTYETDPRSRTELARQNSSNLHKLCRKTKAFPSCQHPLKIHQRTSSRKHAKSKLKRADHQTSMPSNKVDVFINEDTCNGELSCSNNVGPGYSCRTRPFYPFSDRGVADASDLSADDERSQFCQNCSSGSGVPSSLSIRGIDVMLGDVDSRSSQTTRSSCEVVPPLLTSFRNFHSPSTLPNIHQSLYITDSPLVQCKTLSSSRHHNTDSATMELLCGLPLLSDDACPFRFHYCNKRKGLTSLPQIGVFSHSLGVHKHHSFTSVHSLT